MEFLKEALSQSIQTGFLDQLIHSNKDYLPQLLVNDKVAGKKVLTTIDRELKQCDEFWFSVAFVTTSGVATLINTLIDLEKEGKKGKILVSQYLNFSHPEALKRLLLFENIELKIAVKGNFHSKGYLFKNGVVNNLIIGSSNLTANALCENTEWNLKISATQESYIIFNVIKEFANEFEKAVPVTLKYIADYEPIYNKQFESNKLIKAHLCELQSEVVSPNDMQLEALENIRQIRLQGKNKALLISATGTGKTFLSAFDAQKFNPKKFLFVVHRANIAKAAMKTFKTVFGDSKSMGFYSGVEREFGADFIFSTIQTISRPEHLKVFNPEHFDYIVIDETHRAGAESYQKILNHFKPKFLLGMTATPERTDGLDIFKLFDHTIAYEIRLHKAMEENMLSPFHYYGVADITVNGNILEEKADFSKLTSKERIDRIIEKAKLYGCDDGEVRGLIFCSRIDECDELSNGFNKRGWKTISLSKSNSEEERTEAINRLESNSNSEKLDYIFTVDIFNEGIDIPRVNQVIMLRPTKSAIIFVQQLGRGLRKVDNKDYLTVIDFIGNYSNSYLVPIALYGDTSYNKDSLRKLMSSGSSSIPGSSTINFDKISKDRIFEAIDSANMQKKKDLVNDYNLLKFKLGRIPMMLDFLEHGSRDPQLYVECSKSYFNFVSSIEAELKGKLDSNQIKLLELFSNEINNSKRVEESIILQTLIEKGDTSLNTIKKIILDKYNYSFSNRTFESAIKNLNFEFVTDKLNKKLVSVSQKFGIKVVNVKNNQINLDASFLKALDNKLFKKYILDSIDYSIITYNKLFVKAKFLDGFVLYRKYSRKDVFRILNWELNPVAQNVGGYIVSSDKSNSPLFVTLKKKEHISSSIKYEDRFINNSEFEMISKGSRYISSPEIKLWKDNKKGLRIPLFIQKSNDEGLEFYYMGDVTPIVSGFEETTMKNDSGKSSPVVKVLFSMNQPVEDSIYNYLTASSF